MDYSLGEWLRRERALRLFERRLLPAIEGLRLIGKPGPASDLETGLASWSARFTALAVSYASAAVRTMAERRSRQRLYIAHAEGLVASCMSMIQECADNAGLTLDVRRELNYALVRLLNADPNE